MSYNIGNTVNFKSPDGVIQIDITLADLIDISEGKGDLYSPIELNDNLLTKVGFSYWCDVWELYNSCTMRKIYIMQNDSENGYRVTYKNEGVNISREFHYLHELQDIYKALTGKQLILK